MLSRWHFDFYSSPLFWVALVVAVALVRALGSRPRVRRPLLLASSCAMLLAVPGFGLRGLAFLGGVAVYSFAAARLLLHPAVAQRPGRARGVAWLGVVGLVGFLAFFKYRFLQDLVLPGGREAIHGPWHYFSLLGISYFTFKAIHVVVEASKGQLGAIDPITYLGYLSFFPAFVSGPIHRYPEFAAQLEADGSPPLLPDLREAGERIVHGLFKKLVLVPIVQPHILTGGESSAGELVVGLYAYAFYFYFDFSGYSDLAIGAGRLLGVKLPENFNWPFLQKNIRDLWTNWHMTLTSWLVDYIYWPVVRRLRNFEFLRTRPVLLSVLGMNVTFVACGVWHGEAAHFVVWGAYHGLGISVLNLYQRQKRKVRSGLAQRWFQSRASRAVGALLTFHFFAAGLALFVFDLGTLRALLAGLVR